MRYLDSNKMEITIQTSIRCDFRVEERIFQIAFKLNK